MFNAGVQSSGSSESDQGQYLALSTLLSDLGSRLTAMCLSMTTGHPSALDGQSQSHVRLGAIHAAAATPATLLLGPDISYLQNEKLDLIISDIYLYLLSTNLINLDLFR